MKLAPVKVVDREAGRIFCLPGREDTHDAYDSLEQFITEELEPTLNCVISTDLNMWSGTLYTAVFEPPIGGINADAVNDGKFTVSGRVTLEQIEAKRGEFEALADRIRAVGLDPGPIVVTSLLSVY